MADMNRKDDVVTAETEEIMVDKAEPAPIIPHSTYSSNNHFEDQNGVASKNESATVEMAEHHVSNNQPNGQMVDDVTVDIEAMLQEREEHPLSRKCCIYRVPHAARELNKEAYIPKIVSIGPFHHGDSRLQNMERHKQILFKQFIDKAATSLNDLVSFVRSSEMRVRSCYSENIKLSQNEFLKVILIDAGFIIELFWKCYKNDWESMANLNKPWLLDGIILDLLLLENQLPFFILEELFNRAFPPHLRCHLPSFLELTLDMFSYYNKQNLELTPDFRIKHFTDLLRTFHLQKKQPQRQSFEEAGSHVLFYSANELHEAGVKFNANKNKCKCLLDLKFFKGVLEIPQILVEDRTETLFRNMIALEQCHYPRKSYITDYALVLDCLINTSKDVDVLVHEEIIRSYLASSNDVVKLFNGLWKNITQSNFNSDYLDTCKRLNDFYKSPWHKKKAELRSDYCKTPWQTTASIAGIFLILLSLVQAICSILQVAHQI